MNKKFLLLTICIVAVVLVVSIIVIFVSVNFANIFNTKTDDDVPDQETALKLGSELLVEKYNYDLSDPNYILGAKEKDGIWKGSIAPKMREDYIILDGGAYVKFRKSDGKVIEFHLDG